MTDQKYDLFPRKKRYPKGYKYFDTPLEDVLSLIQTQFSDGREDQAAINLATILEAFLIREEVITSRFKKAEQERDSYKEQLQRVKRFYGEAV